MQVPVFWGHCEEGCIVPIRLGRLGVDNLKELGVPVEWKTYPSVDKQGGGLHSQDSLTDVAAIVSRGLKSAASECSTSVKEIQAKPTEEPTEGPIEGCTPAAAVGYQFSGLSLKARSSLLAILTATLTAILSAWWDSEKRLMRTVDHEASVADTLVNFGPV